MNINKNTIQYQHWLGMPDFEQTKKNPYAKIIIRVENAEDLNELAKRLEQPLTHKTKSAWFPFKSHWGAEKKVWISEKLNES
jgi:hypothetical protein